MVTTIQLQTKKSIAHLDVDKLATGGILNSVVTMTIGRIVLTVDGELFTIQASYKYEDALGNEIPTKKGGAFRLNVGLKELSKSINGSLPSDDNLYDRIINEVIIVGKGEMSQTMVTPVENIDVL